MSTACGSLVEQGSVELCRSSVLSSVSDTQGTVPHGELPKQGPVEGWGPGVRYHEGELQHGASALRHFPLNVAPACLPASRVHEVGWGGVGAARATAWQSDAPQTLTHRIPAFRPETHYKLQHTPPTTHRTGLSPTAQCVLISKRDLETMLWVHSLSVCPQHLATFPQSMNSKMFYEWIHDQSSDLCGQ